MIANQRIAAGDALLFGGPAKARKPFKPAAREFQTWHVLEPGAVLLSIDPSISHCGWSLIENVPGRPRRIDSGVFQPIAREDRERHEHLSELIQQRIMLARTSLESPAPSDALIEVPSGGLYGKAKPTQLMVYAQAVGVCRATCHLMRLRLHTVLVTDWKGQGKKGHTINVVRHYFKYEPRDDNEADALGLGLWLCEQRSVSHG